MVHARCEDICTGSSSHKPSASQGNANLVREAAGKLQQEAEKNKSLNITRHQVYDQLERLRLRKYGKAAMEATGICWQCCWRSPDD